MNGTNPERAPPLTAAPNRDVKVMTLIGIGHFLSHFYIMALPPLFPVLKEAFQVSYLQLGLALGILNLTTALTQAPVGFLVDRLGPRAILMTGLSMFALAIALVGLVPTYPALILFMILGGLGNSVFHPADYSILSAAVDNRRMGRAFSIHTFAGFVGFAVAPPVVVTLTALIGWQGALMVAGVVGIVVTIVMMINSAVLIGDEDKPERQSKAGNSDTRGGIQLLMSPRMIIGLLLFTMLAISHGGITSFSVVPLVNMTSRSSRALMKACSLRRAASYSAVAVSDR
jgi:MFS family permease